MLAHRLDLQLEIVLALRSEHEPDQVTWLLARCRTLLSACRHFWFVVAASLQALASLLCLHLRKDLICHSLDVDLFCALDALGASQGHVAVVINIQTQAPASRHVVNLPHAMYEVHFRSKIFREALLGAPC